MLFAYNCRTFVSTNKLCF